MNQLRSTFNNCIVVLMAITLLSCQQNLTYKYSDKEEVFNCASVNTALYSEALYAFEDYILEHYVANPPNTPSQAYAFYWEIAVRDLMPALELIDDHMIQIIEVLKKDETLWTETNGQISLNPEHPLLTCIQENMINDNSKEILKNLLETKTFRPEIFKTHIGYQGKNLINDKALATYFALNNFYAKVLNVDFNTIERKTSNSVQNLE